MSLGGAGPVDRAKKRVGRPCKAYSVHYGLDL
jgi:hypothetical protein